MRRLLIPALCIAVPAVLTSCSDSTLGPVQTVDGTWKGTQSGYALSLTMTQADTLLTSCGASLGSNGGFVQGTCFGTFKYPNLKVTINVTGFLPVDYVGTMSTSEAKIFGKLNGSGISNAEIDIVKQ